MSRKKILWTLFVTCFRIGLFTFGGGFAMIPLMEKEFVDKKSWISREQFISTISAIQSIPGAVAINLSIFLGYDIAGISGAVCTTLGVALPSFIIILLIAMGFYNFNDHPLVINAFRGIRPAVVALIIYAGYRLSEGINWSVKFFLTFIIVLVLTAFIGVNPVYSIFTAIILGFLTHKYPVNTKEEESVGSSN